MKKYQTAFVSPAAKPRDDSLGSDCGSCAGRHMKPILRSYHAKEDEE